MNIVQRWLRNRKRFVFDCDKCSLRFRTNVRTVRDEFERKHLEDHLKE